MWVIALITPYFKYNIIYTVVLRNFICNFILGRGSERYHEGCVLAADAGMPDS